MLNLSLFQPSSCEYIYIWLFNLQWQQTISYIYMKISLGLGNLRTELYKSSSHLTLFISDSTSTYTVYAAHISLCVCMLSSSDLIYSLLFMAFSLWVSTRSNGILQSFFSTTNEWKQEIIIKQHKRSCWLFVKAIADSRLKSHEPGSFFSWGN